MPGPLKMDEGARVVTAEDQQLTGHTGALLCLALLDDRLLFSSSTDLTIKALLKHSSASCEFHMRACSSRVNSNLDANSRFEVCEQ